MPPKTNCIIWGRLANENDHNARFGRLWPVLHVYTVKTLNSRFSRSPTFCPQFRKYTLALWSVVFSSEKKIHPSTVGRCPLFWCLHQGKLLRTIHNSIHTPRTYYVYINYKMKNNTHHCELYISRTRRELD